MQKDVMLESEADAWFERNKEVLLKRTDYSYLTPVEKFIKKDECVLEVGSSFGHNLNYLMNKKGISGFGIEPSDKAVSFGKEIYPELKIKKGTLDNLDIFEKKFDHVVIGFCLYLTDIELLPSMVFNVDKVLRPGGYIHIIDFDSKYPVEKSYSHDSRLKTRKMDYSSLFCAFPNYFLVEKNSWSHSGSSFHVDTNERCSTVTLYKEIQ